MSILGQERGKAIGKLMNILITSLVFFLNKK